MSAHINNHTSSAVAARRTEKDAMASRRDRRTRAAGGTRGLRLRVHVTRGRLDRRIAAGESGVAVPELALREAQLTSPRNQQRIARDLRRVVAYADEHRGGRPISSVAIYTQAVRRGRWALAELAEQLERAGAVDARGIVLARSLLTDGLSPLFNRHADRTVAGAVRDVRQALEVRSPSAAQTAVATSTATNSR